MPDRWRRGQKVTWQKSALVFVVHNCAIFQHIAFISRSCNMSIHTGHASNKETLNGAENWGGSKCSVDNNMNLSCTSVVKMQLIGDQTTCQARQRMQGASYRDARSDDCPCSANFPPHSTRVGQSLDCHFVWTSSLEIVRRCQISASI